eukprot:9257203-Pyramimonas_sp.AAC.1
MSRSRSRSRARSCAASATAPSSLEVARTTSPSGEDDGSDDELQNVGDATSPGWSQDEPHPWEIAEWRYVEGYYFYRKIDIDNGDVDAIIRKMTAEVGYNGEDKGIIGANFSVEDYMALSSAEAELFLDHARKRQSPNFANITLDDCAALPRVEAQLFVGHVEKQASSNG